MGELPLPPHYHPDRLMATTPIPYPAVVEQAARFAQTHAIGPARGDRLHTCLLLVDVQNTFCTPGFELVVGGAVADNQRLCEFIYRNLAMLTTVVLTLDTHSPFQIFHPLVWIDAAGRRPAPGTIITPEDTETGRWRIDPRLSQALADPNLPRLDDAYARYYTRRLAERGRYPLTIWPMHGLVGSNGHAVVPAIEEAVYFHSVAREAPAHFLLKGESPLTEHYSVFGPEVGEDTRPAGRSAAVMRRCCAGSSPTTGSSSPDRRRATASPGPSTTYWRRRQPSILASPAGSTCWRTAPRPW